MSFLWLNKLLRPLQAGVTAAGSILLVLSPAAAKAL